MMGARNNFLFITVLCSVFILNTFINSIHGSPVIIGPAIPIAPAVSSKILVRRDVADAPSTVDVNNDQVKKFVQQGIDKLNESGKKVELEKIVEAVFFPPAGKLMYNIKIQTKDGQECMVQVMKESGPDTSVMVDCEKKMRKRRESEPVPQDKPMNSKVDDPQVKKYAQEGVDKLNASGQKVRLNEIVEAVFFPPAGKVMYEIKMKVENVENKEDMKVCTVTVEKTSGPDVDVHVDCNSKMMKRATEDMPQIGEPYIADKPVSLDVTKSDIVNYAKDGLKEYAKKYPDAKVEVVEIVEAFYTPVSVFSHSIKVKFGRKVKDEMKTEVCTVYVPQHNGPLPMEVKCDN